MSDLFQNHAVKSCPVECFGQTFPGDDARRAHYLKLLAEKLKDPTFRKIEGFPAGADEDILALSDPPYYTACPNPFIDEFLSSNGQPYDSSASYSKEPFAADVSEGKNDPIYNAHSYHTKVPHKAIMRYILHYTEPGDVVFDGFCGTGMTGVAAQLCGDRTVVESMGYRVDAEGVFYSQEQEAGRMEWKPVSKLGSRHAVLNDLSPAATYISSNYNTRVSTHTFETESRRLLSAVNDELGWMYQTLHTDGRTFGRINYVVWSDVFSCPECAGEVIFWDVAVDREVGKIHDEFACPHCSANLNKRNMERFWLIGRDPATGETTKQAKQAPVWINYSIGTKRFEKKPDEADLTKIEKIAKEPINYWFPKNEVGAGDKTGEPVRVGINRAHHFYSKSSLAWLAALRAKADRLDYRYLVAFSTINTLSKMYRYVVKKPDYKGQGGGILSGTLYIPSLNRGLSVISSYERGISRLSAIFDDRRSRSTLITTESASNVRAPDNSIDYIFLDPPFGSNIMYSELNYLWESWLKVSTNSTPEAIENKTQKKDLEKYRGLMTKCFKEAYRLLKPGRWMTVEFSNTQASVWNAIQIALQDAGFVVANVAALDKKQGSFNAINNKTSVKQDLVISAYKPDGGLEDRFAKTGGSEDSVWDFVRTHLNYLPTVKVKNGVLDFIAERDPRIIFDRMVAWFIRHNVPVPMSTHEFQAGLTQRFIERDGMVFLPDQVTEYDKKRMQVAIAPQMEMFISDERSAIDWLTDFLKRRPSTYQEVHTDFISQLGAGWKKHESKPELVALLEDNFIQYDGNGEVPSQIHSYLSTNHKDLRGLEKNNRTLVTKAKDRWYVPDPNKAQDLEKKREKALLKEFDHYRSFTGRRLKEFRLEALRAGFRAAWASKDYATIINIAKKVPEEALQEDEKLLTLYDLALTRTEAGA
jgi:DNA modification methylase